MEHGENLNEDDVVVGRPSVLLGYPGVSFLWSSQEFSHSISLTSLQMLKDVRPSNDHSTIVHRDWKNYTKEVWIRSHFLKSLCLVFFFCTSFSHFRSQKVQPRFVNRCHGIKCVTCSFDFFNFLSILLLHTYSPPVPHTPRTPRPSTLAERWLWQMSW